MRPLSTKYPSGDVTEEQRTEAWMEEYSKKTENFATCRLIQHMGRQDFRPEVARIVEFHDTITRASSGLDLA